MISWKLDTHDDPAMSTGIFFNIHKLYNILILFIRPFKFIFHGEGTNKELFLVSWIFESMYFTFQFIISLVIVCIERDTK